MPPRSTDHSRVKRRIRLALRWSLLVVIGLAGGLSLVTLTSLAIGGYDWTVARARALVTPSSILSRAYDSVIYRWAVWSCDTPPSLAGLMDDSNEGWELEYSWTRGYGAGDVALRLRSDGAAALILSRRGDEEPRTIDADIPRAVVMDIARSIDATAFLCLEPRRRLDHHIIDLGRYSVTVTAGTYSREVHAGECDFVERPEAFSSVTHALQDLESYFGEDVVWGPYGTTTMSGPCPGGG